MSNQRYMMRGVSASKEDVHNAIKNIDKGIFPKAFCKIIPDILGGDPDYCNIMHADGAGTKSSLAYMYWKETGDLSVWKAIVFFFISSLSVRGQSYNNVTRANVGIIDNVRAFHAASHGRVIDAGKLVLSPTRTYAPVVKKLLDALRSEIHGMVHCSGGAQTKVLHFVENVRVVKDNLFPVPKRATSPSNFSNMVLLSAIL